MLFDNKIVNGLKKVPVQVYVGLIILFAVIRLCIIFTQRDGHHVDETWSYGFANSYEYAQVYDGYEDNSESNLKTWITGDVLNDYISVSADHRFSFAEVLRNSHYDLSPPLYILILHFVCSLFPGSFSWVYAFAISLICYIFSLILIYLIGVGFTKSKFCGCISIIYYMFSGCGTANFIFLRVYFLLTVLSLFLFWVITKIIKNESGKGYIYYILLPFATILGSLTHYYFLILAFFFTLFAAFALLFKKRIKDFFSFGFTMLASVILFFMIYTPALEKLLPYSTGDTSGTGYFSYPYHMNLSVANARFFLASIGWFIGFNVSDLMLFCGAIVLAVIFVILILGLFRNESWMKSFLQNLKTKLNSIRKLLKCYFKEFDVSIIVAVFSAVAYMLIIPYSASLVNMGYTERYFFPAMTLFIVAYYCFFGVFAKYILRSRLKTTVRAGLIFIMFFLSVYFTFRSNMLTDSFKFAHTNEKTLINEAYDKDCYVVGCFDRDLTWLSADLNHSNNVYFNFQKDFVEDGFSVPELESGSVILIVESGLMTEEQKEEFINDASFSVVGYYKPEAYLTLNEIVSKIQEDTGYTCTRVDECYAFIGTIGIYKLG